MSYKSKLIYFKLNLNLIAFIFILNMKSKDCIMDTINALLSDKTISN